MRRYEGFAVWMSCGSWRLEFDTQRIMVDGITIDDYRTFISNPVVNDILKFPLNSEASILYEAAFCI